jgi:hypothetical protein
MVSHGATPAAPNRIDLPGTAEETWKTWAGLSHLPAVDPLGWPSAVIVAAHPDDEILGVGGHRGDLAASPRYGLSGREDELAARPGGQPGRC